MTLLVLPAAVFLLLLFVYPFLYGLWLSFQPKAGGAFANYAQFFSDPFLYQTIGTTLWLAVPVTLVNLLISVPVALRVRLMRRQRLLTALPGVSMAASQQAGCHTGTSTWRRHEPARTTCRRPVVRHAMSVAVAATFRREVMAPESVRWP